MSVGVMESPKRRKSIVGSTFFQSNHVGVFRIIFSYVPTGTQCFALSRCTKSLWSAFQGMLSVSSTRFHRLSRLNDSVAANNLFAFDPFRPPGFTSYSLPEEVFCTSVGDFEKEFVNDVWYKVLAAVNDKVGNKCFVSGSYALQNFFKNKRLSQINGQKYGDFRVRKCRVRGYGFGRKGEQAHDVDIFILGDKKEETVKLLLKEMEAKFNIPADVEVKVMIGGGGLVNILVDYQGKDRPTLMEKDRLSISKATQGIFSSLMSRPDFSPVQKTGKVLTYQLILKDVHRTPADVFSFFDIDCCKIGFFPTGNGTVTRACIAFIRSMLTGMNFLDLYLGVAGFKHLRRICEYFHRTKIRTTCIPEPLLSGFHTYNGFKPYEYEIVEWNGYRGRGAVRNHCYRQSFGGEYYSQELPSHRIIRESSSYYEGYGRYGGRTVTTPAIYVPVKDLPRNVTRYRTLDFSLKKIIRKLDKGLRVLEIESLAYMPYICMSVGIFERDDGTFGYSDRDFSEVLPNEEREDPTPGRKSIRSRIRSSQPYSWNSSLLPGLSFGFFGNRNGYDVPRRPRPNRKKDSNHTDIIVIDDSD